MSARHTASLRRRLIIQLLGLAALLSVGLYLAVRVVAGGAAEAAQDNVLGASASSISEALRSADEGVLVDIPYSAFAMLGALSQDRVFYRILVGRGTVTGYADLPLPREQPRLGTPLYYTTPFRDTVLRAAAVVRLVPVGSRPVRVLVVVAQTRLGQQAIAARIANTAATLGIGFFVLAGALSWITAASALRPINRLVGAIGRRGPEDLRALAAPAPRELAPLIDALNGFIARLKAALTRTETFIAEAAHHIRTPLAIARTRAEIALRSAESPESRKALRAVIRATDESTRTATQLLDHALVSYRSDHLARLPLDLATVLDEAIAALAPAAGIRDVEIARTPGTGPARIAGDRVLLVSALRNLIDNAIKYSPAESRVEIELRAAGPDWQICISDRGRGLDGADPGALTARFQRGKNVGNVVGSGLGLAIVEEVARVHGGRFVLARRKGGGTCAVLSLPRY